MSRLIFSLSRKALAAVVIILLPVFITFVYGYKRNTALIKEQLLDNLSVVSTAVEAQVDQFIETSRRITRDFSSDGLIIKALDGLAPRGRVAPARLDEHLTRNKLPLHAHVRAIHVVSADGLIVSSTDSSFIGRDVSGEPFFMRAMAGQDVTELLFGPEGVPAIAVTAPVKSPGTGLRTGMVVNLFTLSGLDGVLSGRFQKEHGASPRRKTIEAYLVDGNGAILAGTRPAGGAQKLSLATLPLRTCLNEKVASSGFYRNQMGVDVAGASTCMPALQWTILVERNELEALAPFESMRRDAVIVGVVVAGLISLLFIAFYRTVVLQLQRLSAAARSLAAGDYGQTIPAGTSDEIGELAGSFNSMARDIMSRDSALKTSEEKYRSLIQNIPDVTWTANRASEIVFISPNMEKLSGYSQDEVYRDIRLLFLLAHRDDVDKVVNAHRALFNEEKGYDIEYRIRTKSGQWLWIRDSAATTYFKDGIKYADGMFSDITAKKMAEDALKDGALRLRTAQQIARMGSWDWDILSNTIYWSEEVYRVFGLKEGAFGTTYESFMNYVHPADREIVKKAFFDAMYRGKDYSVEHRMVLPDASVRTVRGEGAVSFNEKGIPARMLGAIQDISERKKAEFELKKLSMAIEHSVNIVFITDKNGVIEYVNPMFEEVTGYSREEALG
ncbi:MAG: PAS domain-containing protein, partial [Deltaproteobacteria bacterium]|nr:PAS domain-containing protein [Deltaproteobacteria bacterium]